ncbi:MAG: DUF1284 domain-containing protein [Nitrospirota bacterium]
MSVRVPATGEQPPIRLRGHTLLCLQGFRGEGYSPGFVENLASVHRDLRDHPDRWVLVVDEPDDVCRACPHRGPGGCTLNGEDSEDVMRAQDRHVLERLGLQTGAKVRWRDILDRIGVSLSGEDLPGLCGACRWLPLGYCREGIGSLRGQEVISIQSSVFRRKPSTEGR